MSIDESSLLESPIVTVFMSICIFKSNGVSFIESGVLVFGPHMLRMVIPCCWSFTLMSVKCPSFSLLTSFGLNSILSDIRMAIPACFLGQFS